MSMPLIVRLLLDAQGEFLRAADAVPTEARDRRIGTMNTAGWVVAHTGFIHDVWMNVDAQGLSSDECEPSLHEWFKRQQEAGMDPIDAPFDEARAALDRVVERVDRSIRSLTEASLDEVPAFEPDAWPEDTTVGYLVARDVAHLFAHASELNVIATSARASDIGLPGPLSHTRHG